MSRLQRLAFWTFNMLAARLPASYAMMTMRNGIVED